MQFSSRIFVQDESGRKPVSSLRSFLKYSSSASIMEPSRIKAELGQYCRWAGFRLLKGVTDATQDSPITVLSLHSEMVTTLHGLLIQGFPGVDEYPWCYYPDDSPGFAGFVRWAYFCDPAGRKDVFAVDYSPGSNPGLGKARDFRRVKDIARVCMQQGVPLECELVLANSDMLEEKEHFNLRQAKHLHTINNWVEASF